RPARPAPACSHARGRSGPRPRTGPGTPGRWPWSSSVTGLSWLGYPTGPFALPLSRRARKGVLARRGGRAARSVAHAVAGRGEGLPQVDHFHVLDADVAHRVGVDAHLGPLVLGEAIVGRREGGVATVGEEHAVALHGAGDHPGAVGGERLQREV